MWSVIGVLLWTGFTPVFQSEASPVIEGGGGDPAEAFRKRFPEKIGLLTTHDDKDDVCSLERTLLPKTLIEGKYQTMTMSVDLLNELMRDFALIVEATRISVWSEGVIDQNDFFDSMSVRSCSLGILGLNWIETKELADFQRSLMTVTIFCQKKGDDVEYFCLCRNPLVGLNEEQCMRMLNGISTKEYGVPFPQNISSAPKYPAYVYKGKLDMGLYEEGDVITCADGQLKLAVHSLYREYQSLMTKVARVTDMYNISIPAMACNCDLAAATPGRIAEFTQCVKEATSEGERDRRDTSNVLIGPEEMGRVAARARANVMNSSQPMPGARGKRDLLSALGIREDYSEYIAASNKIIQDNFEVIRDHEAQMLSILKKESAHMKRYMSQENRNIDALISHLGYLRTQLNHQGLLAHNRELILSSFQSLTLTLKELNDETQALLEIVLSPLQGQNPVCMIRGCLDKDSLLIDKRSGGLVVSIREIQIESAELLRMSCRLMEKEGKLFRHGLTDKTLWPLNGKLVERESLVVVSDECVRRGEGCPESHAEISADALIQRVLYISTHHGRLEAQCLEEVKITTISGQLDCGHKPVVVTLPMALNGKRLDTASLHLWITMNKKSDPISDFEIGFMKANHIPSYDWSIDNIAAEFQKPFALTNPFQVGAMLAGIILACLVILCCSLCYCPHCTRGLMQGALGGCCTAWTTLTMCVRDCRDSCNGDSNDDTVASSGSSGRASSRVPSTQPRSGPSRSRDMFSASGGSGADNSSDDGSGAEVDPAHARSEALLRALPKFKKKRGKAPSCPAVIDPGDLERDIPSPDISANAEMLRLEADKENMPEDVLTVHRHTVWDGHNWFPSMKKGCSMECTAATCEVVESHDSSIILAKRKKEQHDQQNKAAMGRMGRVKSGSESGARDSAQSTSQPSSYSSDQSQVILSKVPNVSSPGAGESGSRGQNHNI